MIVMVDEQQKPVTSASITILSICLQQTYSASYACGSLCAQRTTRIRCAADFGRQWVGAVNKPVSVQNRRAKSGFYAQKDEK